MLSEVKTMTYTKLKEKYKCDSVLAREFVRPEYCVYNWDQVEIVSVKDTSNGNVLYQLPGAHTDINFHSYEQQQSFEKKLKEAVVRMKYNEAHGISADSSQK